MKSDYSVFNFLRRYTGLLSILSFVFVVSLFSLSKQAFADVLVPGTVYGCGEIASTGTYTLSSTSTFSVASGTDCFVVTAGGSPSDTVIDGNGMTVNGNVKGNGTGPGLSGSGFMLENAIVNGLVSSNGHDTDSICSESVAGSGGSLSISSSTVTSVSSNGGTDNFSCGLDGLGGAINISNSTVTSSISSNGGPVSGYGGNISDNGNTINLSNVSISSIGGTSGSNGSLSLVYSGNLITNINTIFSALNSLHINNIIIPLYTGGIYFHSTTYYYNNATGDGNWGTLGNWWFNSSFTGSHPGTLPNNTDSVVVSGNINYNNSGSVPFVHDISFGGTSINNIEISVTNGATFNDSSVNAGKIAGTAVFKGNDSSNTGTINNATSTNSRVWTNNGNSSGLHNWSSVASNSLGTKLVAADSFSGYIYTSINSGVTWSTNGNSSGTHKWKSVDSDITGNKLVAADNNGGSSPGGYIYTSTDAGITWSTNSSSSGQHYWRSVASDETGLKLVAVDAGLGGAGGLVYTSTDGGVTWSTHGGSSGSRRWNSVASGADGSRLIAVDGNNGYIYVSSDGGVTWSTNGNSSGIGSWVAVSSDSTGYRLVAAVSTGYIYTSTDGGLSWSNHSNSSGSNGWTSIKSNGNGTVFIASEVNHGIGYLHYSTDGGVTWSTNGNSSGQLNWSAVTLDSTGQKMFATVISGYVYTSGLNSDDNSNKISRLYEYNTPTTVSPNKDFTSDGGRSDWTIISEGAGTVVDLSSSTYDLVTDTFQSISGGIFKVNSNNLANIPAGFNWTSNSNSSGNHMWTSVASDATGLKLVATDYSPGYIYTSTDSGVTWSTHTGSSGVHSWFAITSDSTGNKLAAVDSADGYIYTSTDAGATWSTNTNSSGQHYWTSIASDSSGLNLIASDGVRGGYIYTSTDGGVTWSTHSNSSGINYWRSVASDSTGQNLVAGVGYNGNSGYIYTSTDGGVTWSNHSNSSGQHVWRSITSDSTGQKLAAVDPGLGGAGGYIYTSTDGGVTWSSNTNSSGAHSWSSITSDSTGQKLAATAYNANIYTSTNAGIAWTKNVRSGEYGWSAIVSNASSSKIVAAVSNGSIYTSSAIVGLGVSVFPVISIVAPTSSALMTKWSPSVVWDTSTVCEYSFDNFATTHVVSCGSNGSDIPHPSVAGTSTLYIKGTDINGFISESNGVSFNYDNTVPTYTLCGSDLLDESTRPYYYLTGNVAGDCKATVNTKLQGNISSTTPGYSISGNFIATTSVNGLSVVLSDISVDGNVIANGSDNSGTGYNGGSINISNATTSNVYANGGSGTSKGGNGGTVLISDSLELSTSTIVSANGGSASQCGYGGNGGSANITDSTYLNVVTNPGSDKLLTINQGGFCPNLPSGSSGSSGSYQSVGTYNNPVAPTPVNNPTPPIPVTQPVPQSTPVSGGSSSGTSISSISPTQNAPVENIQPEPVSIPHAIAVAATKAIQQVTQTADNITSSPVGKTVQTLGFFGGMVASVVTAADSAFASPLAASELLLIPTRLWGLLLLGLGIRRKARPWGTVYDSVTKQPIDPAYVTARDSSGKVVAESITDIDGRYGFLLPDGTYYVSVEKTNYVFPSVKMSGKATDELYNDLYFGEPVVIHGGEVLDKNIPMDQKGFDWNEFTKKERSALSFHGKHEKPWAKISNYTYMAGLVISVIATAIHPSNYNVVILVLYMFLLMSLNLNFSIKRKKLGNVTDRVTREPLSYAIVRVTAFDHQVVLRTGVTDEQGRYYAIVPKGQCYVDIEKKNPDGSYSKVYSSGLIVNRTGLINADFEV